MITLQQLITNYQATSNDDEKAELIETDFDVLVDNAKWDFLLPLLADKETYDLVKVNIYKIIEVADFTGISSSEIKNRVLIALKAEEDEMVRQYGFMALTWSFSSFTDVIDYCMLTVENAQEDEDVRHCAFSVLTKSTNYNCIATLRDRLMQVEDFAKYAITFYNERDKNSF